MVPVAGLVNTGVGFIVTDEVAELQFVVASVNENVTVPTEIALTKPALVTVAIALLLLVQLPPVVGDNMAVAPRHTEAGADTTGNAFTVTAVVVLLQFVEPSIKVNVTVPGDTPVMTPAFVTDAMLLLLLVHAPPLVGDKASVEPTQTDAGAVTIGSGFIVIVWLQVDVFAQLSIAVHVIVCGPTLKIAPSNDDPVLGLTPASVV
jgi:hypothetical protein